MTHAEFHRAVAAYAGGKYYTTKVEVGTHGDGSLSFEFQVYRHDHGWSDEFKTAEECLASLVTEVARPVAGDPESIGDVAADLMAKNLNDAIVFPTPGQIAGTEAV